MPDELAEHFRVATTGQSMRAMAERIGMVHTTLADQLRKRNPPVQTVVALCRAYGLPFAPAFIAAGFLTPEEAAAFSGPVTLTHVSDLELAKEMVRRVDSGEPHALLHQPLDEHHPAMAHLQDEP